MAGLLATALLAPACSPSTKSDTRPSEKSVEAPAEPVEDELAEAEPEAPEADKAPAEPPPPAYEPREEDLVEVHQPIEHPEALANFFDALEQVDGGAKRVVRVVHMGASAIGADDLPSILRERFQTRFGDGGAGLVLMDRYMPNYLHRWVQLQAEGWEHCYIAYKCLTDGHYGIGGTAFWSGGGAKTWISTRKHELGDEVSIFELWYLARPGGGKIEMRVDRDEPVVIDTRAEDTKDAWHRIEVERGAHKIRVRTLGRGNVRAYGVLLETDGPGLVWDQFSKLGVFTNRILEWDGDHLAAQIGHRDPDLIVFTYGGNDVRRIANGSLDMDGYVAEYKQAVAHMRRGKPEASCLITGITDRERSLTYEITPEEVEAIVESQRKVAEDSGCAFFDTYTAMGGGGSLRAWKNKSPPLAAPDLKHLNHRGRLVVGGWLYDAVISAYVDHRRTRAGGGE